MHLDSDLLQPAYTLASEKRWGPAALAFLHAARSATVDATRKTAWEGAGTSFRRDDTPKAAERALRMALSLPGDPAADAVIRVQLAGALADLGRGREALELCLEATESPEAEWLAVDTMASLVQTWGARGSLLDLVDRMQEVPGLEVATAFRRGQLQRLSGQLGDAIHSFGTVIESFGDDPDKDVARAGAGAELATVALLRGDATHAIALFEQGLSDHESAGRRSLAWHCEAGRVQALVEADAGALVNRLDAGIAFADQRDLLLLGVDLHLARGMALAASRPDTARQELDAARQTALGCGARFRAGRALYERVKRTERGGAEQLATAAEDMAISLPWSTRARALQAMRSDAGTNEVVALVARFEAMDMRADAMALRERLS